MKPGLLILGDRLPDPHWGERVSHAQRHRRFVEMAVRAEALGFDSVWPGEHHVQAGASRSWPGAACCAAPAATSPSTRTPRATIGAAMSDHGGMPEKLVFETLEPFGERVLPETTKEGA